MWFKKTPLPPIELRFNLPPNGTYPPRILIPEKSIWLKGDVPIKLTRNVAIKRERDKWLLYRTDERTKVLVNGQEFFGEHMLQDGDYIRIGKFKGIFQADPVADFRVDVEKETKSTSIIPTQRMNKWVIIDGHGISLDGGQNKAKWDEIVTVEFENKTGSSSWRIKLILEKKKRFEKFPTKLKWITRQEFLDTTLWIISSAPFTLSTNDSNRHIWPDAYVYTIYNKLIIPNENNESILPETAEKILGIWTKQDSIKLILGLFAVIGILTFLWSHPTGLNEESIERFIRLMLMTTVGIIAGTLISMIIVGIPFLIIQFLKRIIKIGWQNKHNNDSTY